MIAEISGRPSSSVPVRAVTVTTEVMSVPELVMNALAPSTTHSPPSSTALVRVAPASRAGVRLGEAEAGERAAGDEVGQPALLLRLGAVGEDRVDAEADAGRQRDADRLVDPPELLDRDAQAGEVAAVGRRPPYSSGTTSPNSPRSPILGTRSAGKWCSRSHWATCGATSCVGELAHDRAEVLVVLAQLEHRRSFAQVVRPPGRGAWRGRRVLDVDVNVKQYGRYDNPRDGCRACPGPDPALTRRPDADEATAPGRSRRSPRSSGSPTARCATTRTSA